jgi:hypothetical protein
MELHSILCDEIDKRQWEKGTTCITVLFSHHGIAPRFDFIEGAVMGPATGAP